jgi:hypothetical protein
MRREAKSGGKSVEDRGEEGKLRRRDEERSEEWKEKCRRQRRRRENKKKREAKRGGRSVEDRRKEGFPVFAGLWYPANNICIS